MSRTEKILKVLEDVANLLDSRANNILRIGLAGIRKGIRTEKEKEA